MTNDEIEALARRECWRYKKSGDPHHSDTYTFNTLTLREFARKLAAERLDVCKEAATVLRIEAASLRQCHTLNGEWGEDEQEAREEYERMVALADRLAQPTSPANAGHERTPTA
ncbi:hypothetical protein U5817_09770 [Aromatoleum evansii]|uniref:Uncharacterized protein n=1 Tax=Aromatoleum evansii TaxID=59406 RepID=A0ABZ1AW13_AROEV|nr:hypothetical protein U5817_09420 [Aromatoleum evansii]WRL48313.1 hypothetical protein U5817_09770 [Aromatoleum evansii]